MAIKISGRGQYEIGGEIVSRLYSAFRHIKSVRTLANSGDASSVMLIPQLNKDFQAWVTVITGTYTSAEIKTLVESYLPDTISMADITGFINAVNATANAIEAGIGHVVVGINASKLPVYSFDSAQVKSSVVASLDAALSYFTE